MKAMIIPLEQSLELSGVLPFGIFLTLFDW